jgi:hypothetical protein
MFVQAVEAQFELQAFAPLQPRRNRLCFRECGLTLGIQSACAVLPMDGPAESGMISFTHFDTLTINITFIFYFMNYILRKWCHCHCRLVADDSNL